MTRRSLQGFTIVELIIVITVSGILTFMLFNPLNELYNDNTRGLKNILLVTDTRGALRTIEHNITLSYSFYNTNQVADPTGTTWSWAGSGTTSRVLITGNYATSPDETADASSVRTLIYDSTCATPLLNNYIYFVNGGILYRRTIKNTSTTCSGAVGQKQTCAAGYTNPACNATDAILLSNVTDFTVDYYATASSATPLANQYSDTSVPGTAKSIVIKVTTRSGTGSSDSTATSTLRLTRINGTTS